MNTSMVKGTQIKPSLSSVCIKPELGNRRRCNPVPPNTVTRIRYRLKRDKNEAEGIAWKKDPCG